MIGLNSSPEYVGLRVQFVLMTSTSLPSSTLWKPQSEILTVVFLI
jgi:hypothetical protein